MGNMDLGTDAKRTCIFRVEDKSGKMPERRSAVDEKINASIKISDNPFDVLSQSLYRKSEASREEHQPNHSMVEDNIFEELLVKSRAEPAIEEEKIPYGIFTSMILMADMEIHAQDQRMYKFPFDPETRNDGSQLFEKMYSEYLIAIKSVFREYKRSNIRFYMKFKHEFLVFDSCLKVTSGMRKELARNEIEFEDEGSLLIIRGVEVALAFDYIVNASLSPSSCIPFILSESPFENGILFSVRLQKKHAIREGKRILYSYELLGPFWADDYKELARFCIKVV
ncbi:hypothetical protein M970_090240 [Encephalitozoon cuniculi EcunIII-L]|uniref:Uncharacterized protein n=1 Tax=Encephalitozoon cuniculi TaxID=6035 RepID=M1JL14_ENCCN|nr:hypothetical protein ECU09_0240 [Encephalitozoon cuniculi]KMV65503.1 hypothetical protein M970_090240 [Encephalitozoon cuniculi EcunIII-L]UYI26701.1 DUF5095 domain-containing protein [Encephalitozoon cuniculi]